MKLKVYLAIHDMTVKAFSEKLDVHRAYMSGIITGRWKPSKRLRKKILEETGGEVTLDETYPPENVEDSPIIPSEKVEIEHGTAA
jgi:hypothetical protein